MFQYKQICHQKLHDVEQLHYKSVEILNDILGVNKSSAQQILVNKYDFNEKQVIEILHFTHPQIERPL